MSYIYKITNTKNNKIYIGQTNRTVPIRWKQHKFRYKDGTSPLYEDMKKYGIESFIVETLQECDPEDRFDLETSYILHYNCMVPNGYNAVLNQNNGSEEMYLMCKSLWEEGKTVKQIGEELKLDPKRVGCYLKRVGITQEEIYERRGKKRGIDSSKAVIQYSPEGEFIQRYTSASEAGRSLGKRHSSIAKCCCGDLLTAYGYIWQYEDDDDIEELVLFIKNKKGKVGKRSKPIMCYDLNHNFIAEYESASAAGRSFGVAHSGIAYAARNGGIAYGYYWKYKE